MTRRSKALAFLCCVALTGCATSPIAPRQTTITPEARPAGVVAPRPAAPAGPEQSAASREMAAYYSRVQTDLLAQGLLRTDGGGPDAPFTDTMLVRNFMAVALQEEYVRGQGLRPSGGAASAVKKWTQPVRLHTEFTPNVPVDQRGWDTAEVTKFANRLRGITGHDIAVTPKSANFHVIFAAQDDHGYVADRIRQIVPDVNPSALRLLRNLPRGIHCLVVAFATENGGYDYGSAVAVIRSEHPELMRRSCIHEELSQGFGLTNDSPTARPSIFNDDDEFAYLTTQDAMMLQILYDPRLRPGMRAEQALPIVQERATALTGGDTPT
ncbi:DUF2927 domain-containing protein [Sagittula salina]|uniref:DUF2927 domain-containing protein n=1 Tax=Sagittula salina TaxID=2820268 RepID=A0A940S0Q9_9RHOB|nr:DUF2927 domain-containing protein [Sagittula salina]MBP0482282.1 DUF2927 domain-containing protein [Sagittula salina]